MRPPRAGVRGSVRCDVRASWERGSAGFRGWGRAGRDSARGAVRRGRRDPDGARVRRRRRPWTASTTTSAARLASIRVAAGWPPFSAAHPYLGVFLPSGPTAVRTRSCASAAPPPPRAGAPGACRACAAGPHMQYAQRPARAGRPPRNRSAAPAGPPRCAVRPGRGRARRAHPRGCPPPSAGALGSARRRAGSRTRRAARRTRRGRGCRRPSGRRRGWRGRVRPAAYSCTRTAASVRSSGTRSRARWAAASTTSAAATRIRSVSASVTGTRRTPWPVHGVEQLQRNAAASRLVGGQVDGVQGGLRAVDADDDAGLVGEGGMAVHRTVLLTSTPIVHQSGRPGRRGRTTGFRTGGFSGTRRAAGGLPLRRMEHGDGFSPFRHYSDS